MPVMDGLTDTKLIRELEGAKDKRTPIVALTVCAMLSDKEKFMAVGMDDYLSKPISIKALLDIIFKYTQAS